MTLAEKMSINSNKKNISRILKIIAPKIITVAALYSTEKGIIAQRNLDDDTLQYQSMLGAYYLPETNVIYLARYGVKTNYKKNEVKLQKYTEAETAFLLAHELRHAWQKKYDNDTYFAKNANGLEIINDIAEIDADAFAIAYIFGNQTSYTGKDFPTTLFEIFLQGTLDNGKRFERANNLTKEYAFSDLNKLEEAKKFVDQDELKLIATMFKLNGLM